MLLLTVTLFIISFLIGTIIENYYPNPLLCNRFVDGFIFFAASFQLVSTPLLLFHLPFYTALIGYWLIVLIGSFWYLCLYRRVGLQIIKAKITIKSINLSLILCVIVILFQAITSSFFQFADRDDSFYVGLAETSIDSLALYSFDPSLGDTEFLVMSPYSFQSWELSYAVLAKTFSLPPAVIAHTVLPFFLIIMAYFSYAYLAQQIIIRHNIPIFLCILSIFYIFSGYSIYSQGSFLLTRIWQGKAVLLHIILPYLIANLILFFKSDYSRKYIWKIVIALIAGISFNPIVVFLPTLILATYVLTEFLHYPKNLGKIFPVVLSLLPIGLFAITIKLGVTGSEYFDSSIMDFQPLLVLSKYLGKSVPFVVFYILCVIFMYKDQDYYQKLIFIFSPALLLIFVWNPLIAPFIAYNITSIFTYWRVYWLFPLGMGIAFSLEKLYHRQKKSYFYSSLTIILVFNLLARLNIYNDLEQPQNLYKLPQEHVDIAQFLEKSNITNLYVLAPEEVNISIRQISSEITLFWSRNTQSGEYPKRPNLETMLYPDENIPSEIIINEFDKSDINVIIVPRSNVILFEKIGSLKQIFESKNYYVFYYPNS